MEEEQIIDNQILGKNSKPTRPNLKRAKLAELFIWIVMAIDIISLVSSYLQYNLLIAIQNNEEVSEQMLNSNDNREGVIGVLYFIIYVISGVVFIQWFRRAYYNLNLRTTCEHSEGWAAGCWFVPIMNLFRPYQIMKEMWIKTNDLLQLKSPDHVNINNSTSLIGFWWTLWIISNFIGQYVFKIAFKSETIEDYIGSTLANMVLSGIGIPLAILIVLIIRSYASKEEKIYQLEINDL